MAKYGFQIPDEDLEKFVTDPDPQVRAAGRLLASSIPHVLQDWINAECQRDTHIIDIISAVSIFLSQVVGSLVATNVKEEMIELVVEHMLTSSKNKAKAHAVNVRQEIKEGRIRRHADGRVEIRGDK
jgi:hypothetical protein